MSGDMDSRRYGPLGPRTPGRPRKYHEPIRSFLLWLPESLYTQIRSLAQSSNLSVTDLIQRALREYLNKIPDQDPHPVPMEPDPKDQMLIAQLEHYLDKYEMIIYQRQDRFQLREIDELLRNRILSLATKLGVIPTQLHSRILRAFQHHNQVWRTLPTSQNSPEYLHRTPKYWAR